MDWIKLAARPAYYYDGALLRAGEAAEVLFIRGLAHCGAQESGGLIEKVALPLLVADSEPRAAALVREGLWVDEGTHYRVRTWDVHQDAHDEAAHRRRLDRERQKKRRSQGVSRDVSRDSHVMRHVTDRDCHAVEGEGEGEEEQPTTSVVARKRASRATRLPVDWPAPEDRADLSRWASEHTPAVDPEAETPNWRDWHLAKGDTAKDWNASWRTWMRRAQKDAESRGRTSPLRTAVSTTDQRVAQAQALKASLRAVPPIQQELM